MLVDVDNSNGVLTATEDDGYAVSSAIDIGDNLSVESREDVFVSDRDLLEGNRVSILVGDEYVQTTLVVENIISRDPFEYDTSTITNGEIPLKVVLTGETRIEITDISIAMEFQNLSISTQPDILRMSRNILESDVVVIVTRDKVWYKVPHKDTDFGSGGSIDTSTITKGEVPSKAYIPGVELSFGDTVAKENKIKYSTDTDGLSVLFTKERLSIVTSTIKARLDFKHSGDKITSLKYKASRMVNSIHIGSKASIRRDIPTIALYQTIHYPMRP